jgi:hypothetical protein
MFNLGIKDVKRTVRYWRVEFIDPYCEGFGFFPEPTTVFYFSPGGRDDGKFERDYVKLSRDKRLNGGERKHKTSVTTETTRTAA